MIDSHQPRFAQAVQGLLLAVAFLAELEWLVGVVAVLLIAGGFGGPRFNLLGYLYRALPIPRGEPEPAAPPRFSQRLGAVFLTVSVIGLYTAAPESTTWWVLGWGPALLVTVLCFLAASTGFCLGCEMYMLGQRLKTRRA